MSSWVDFGVSEVHRAELLAEAERWRLVRALREARKGRVEMTRGENSREPEIDGIEVRWGLPRDEEKVAELLELNGMPRWVAFEERFIVAERNGEVLAAVRYRTASKRLSLGLLAADPWVEERPLAVALYAGAGELARGIGVSEVFAKVLSHGNYPREAGYRWRGRGEWRLEVARIPEDRNERPAVGWRKRFALLGTLAIPFFGAFSARK